MTADKNKAAKEKAPKEKKARPKYVNLPQAKAILDEEKRLKAVPSDFSFTEHAPLKKGDFVSEDLYMEWKAALFDHRAVSLTSRANELRTEAAHQRKFCDPSTKSKFKRYAKLAEKMKELEAELKAAGVQVEG